MEVARRVATSLGRVGVVASLACTVSGLGFTLLTSCGDGAGGTPNKPRDEDGGSVTNPDGTVTPADRWGGDSIGGFRDGSRDCPLVRPTDGDPCRLARAQSCEYAAECVGSANCTAACIGAAWFVSCPPCAPVPDCPSSLPDHGSACPDGPTYKCVFQNCDVNENFLAATCKAGSWNVDSRICASPGCPPAGEDGPSGCPGFACVVGPECETNAKRGCQPNPCSTAPFSCACAASLCPGSICDSARDGVVTCKAIDRGPSDPIVVAEHLNLPGPMALYAGVLYVATESMRAGHSTSPVLAIDTSSGAVQGISTQVGSAYDVAVDASGVFWTEPGELKWAALGGGSPTSLLQGIHPQRLGLDADYVYFTTDASDPANPNRIERIPKNGGTAEVIASAVRTAGIAVAANGVYFADRNNATNEGIISFVPSAGGPSRVLATQQGFPSLLALDARRVYWLDEWPPDVKALDVMGSAPTTLYAASAGASAPKGIYLDASDLYFTDADTGNVMRVAKDGGPVTTLAQGPPGPSGIVVDAEQVYWVIASSADCGRVLRIHK